MGAMGGDGGGMVGSEMKGCARSVLTLLRAQETVFHSFDGRCCWIDLSIGRHPLEGREEEKRLAGREAFNQRVLLPHMMAAELGVGVLCL